MALQIGKTYYIKNVALNKYLNIYGNEVVSNGRNVNLYDKENVMAQKWIVQLRGNGAVVLSALNTAYGLNINTGDNNNCTIWPVASNPDSDCVVDFLTVNASQNLYRIKILGYNRYLALYDVSSANVYWSSINDDYALWQLEEVTTVVSTNAPTELKDKTFFVKNYNTGYNLNVYGTDTVANERNVNVYSKEKCLAQKWIVRQKSDGAKLFTTINEAYALNINTNTNNCSMYTESSNSSADSVLEFIPYTDATVTAADKVFKIKMANRNKYLDVESVGSGANAYWVSSPAYPLWQFVSESDMFPTPKACPTAIKDSTFAIQANGTDFYLNVHGTDTVADGRNVNIYSKDDALAQRWIPKQTTEGPKLFTKINEDFALNIHTVDNNCTMYTASGNDEDSLLEFESVGTMQYKIKMFNHKKYLAIDGTADPGSNVVWVDGSANATVWNFIPETTAFPTPNPAPTDLVGKTFFIKNYNTGYNLNVHGTNTVALGRNVNVFAKEPEDSQRWQVVQTPKGPKIITEINPDFALNIHVENNNNCVMYDIDDNNVDSVIEFVPYDEDKNIYKLKMFHHNKYLEAAGVGSGFNAYWSDSPVYNLWQFVEEDDMFPPVEDAPADIADKVFFIQNVNTGHFLNVHGTNTVANTRNVNVYAKENANAQRWIIRNKDGGPKLVTKIDETFAVNIYANDNNCTMYKEDGNDIDSVLQFIPYTTGQTAAEDDVYRIKMHYHNRYLTVSNTNIGANAWWTSVDSEPYALWKLIPESEMTFDGVTDTDTTPDSSLVSVFMPAHSNNYMVGRAGNQISEITIHHTAAVASSVERIGDDWQNPERGASSHYCVRGTRVGQFVKECNTAYTNGGSLKNPDAGNPNVKAVTIETCNSTGDPTWEVSDDTYYTLVRLVADIARRNNLGTLIVGQNLKTHQDHAYTICPGPYLLAKMQDIADRANKINNATYIRKHNTSLYLGVNSNNEIIWTDRDGAKGWDMVESGSKYVFRDINDSSKILQIAEDGETPILSNSTNSSMRVYGIRTSDGLIKIFAESLLRSSSILLSLVALNKGRPGFDENGGDDMTDKETDNSPVYTSNNGVNFTERVQRIKCTFSETGNTYYLTAASGNEYHPSGAGVRVDLAPRCESDERQFWKISIFPNGWYGISSIAYPNRYLEIDPKSNAAIINDKDDKSSLYYLELNEGEIPEDYAPQFNNAIISITRDNSSSDKYIMKMPTHNKVLGLYATTATSFASWLDKNPLYWDFEEPEPIVKNDWLRLYYNPTTNSPHRTVDMPIIEPYWENGTYYTFSNRHDWLGWEPPYGTLINPEAFKLEGYTPDIVSDVPGALEDTKGNFWIAVGPNVVNEYHKAGESILPSEMYGKGKLDAVVENDKGIKYYIPCVVGDTKAHTYPNGIVQTDLTYPYGTYAPDTDRGEKYDAVSPIEFIGNLSGLTGGITPYYRIYNIRFYSGTTELMQNNF